LCNEGKMGCIMIACKALTCHFYALPAEA
jgi:hypothetical protein